MSARWSCGSTDMSDLIRVVKLPRRTWRIWMWWGQRNRKWELVSASRERLTFGSLQLKLWWNLWARKSDNSTRNFVKSFNPAVSLVPKTDLWIGRINNNNLLLNRLNAGKFLISSSSFSHSEIQKRKKLFSYLAVLLFGLGNSLCALRSYCKWRWWGMWLY